MDFLEKNLTAIGRHKPGLFSVLRSCLAGTAPNGEFRLTDCGGGWMNLEIRDPSGKNSPLYPAHPREATRRALESLSSPAPALVVLNGFGLGYHFMEFMREKPGSVRAVAVVEESAWSFVQALRLHDLTPFFASEEVEFLVGSSPVDFSGVATRFLTRHGRVIFASRIGYLHFEPALAVSGPYYLAFAETLTRAVTQVKEAFSAPGEDNFRALLNVTRNRALLENLPAVSSLEGALRDCPAFLIGSGPSLEPEIAALKRYRDRAVVAAVDAAVKPLLKHGITPDLVVSTERVAVTKHLFDGLPRDLAAPLFALPSSHPDTLASYPGPAVLLRRPATFGAWLWPDAKDDALPLGVTPAACVILRRLGCSEIALLGQDLSWPAGHSEGYADGTSAYAAGSAKDALNAIPCLVPNYSGADVATTLGWKNALSELESLIPTFGIPVRHVIAADRGAKIRGAVRTDPAVYWEEISGRKPLPAVAGRLSGAVSEAMAKAPLGSLRELFLKTAVGLENFIAGMRETLETMSSDYHDRVNDRDAAAFRPEFPAMLAKWRRLEEDLIERDAPLFYFFINMMAGGGYISHLSAREALPPDLGRPVLSLFHYLVKTVDWGNDAAAWAGRALHLLRKHA